MEIKHKVKERSHPLYCYIATGAMEIKHKVKETSHKDGLIKETCC